MAKNNPTPTIEAKIQEYRELGGNPAREMWLRTALITIDQNARLETVKLILESVDDETRQDLESYKVIQALSHPLNK